MVSYWRDEGGSNDATTENPKRLTGTPPKWLQCCEVTVNLA